MFNLVFLTDLLEWLSTLAYCGVNQLAQAYVNLKSVRIVERSNGTRASGSSECLTNTELSELIGIFLCAEG